MYLFSRKKQRAISIVLLLVMVQSLIPVQLFALTSGPAQPETQQFAPAGMDNMVDPFTGDFSYNIPLMDVGGYPLTLNYAAGIDADQEASWVGLGWNLNVGAITRSMRGLPDDFAGDKVEKVYSAKANQTFGLSGDLAFEIYGFETGNLNIGFSGSMFYNTYNGIGTSVGINPNVGSALGTKSNLTAQMGMNLTASSESGFSVGPTAGISYKMNTDNLSATLGANVGSSYNTREGLKAMTFGLTAQPAYVKQTESSKTRVGTKLGTSASVGFTTPTYTPFIEHNSFNVNASLKGVASILPNAVLDGTQVGVSGFYSGEFIEDERTIPAYGYMYSGLSDDNNILMDFNREKDSRFHMGITNLALTNFTHDIFNVSGEGVGGSYRLYRGDVGSVHDAEARSKGHIPAIGVEVGAGGPPPTFEVGVDVAYAQSNNYSGAWKSKPAEIKSFNRQKINDRNLEVAYFKRIGEMAPETDCRFFDDIQVGYDAIKHKYGRRSGKYAGDKDLSGEYTNARLDDEGSEYSKDIHPDNFREVKRLRNIPFTPLTAEEAKDANVLPIQNYEFGHFDFESLPKVPNANFSLNSVYGYKPKEEIERVSDYRKGHHLSEIRVANNSGTRYIYGIPVYTKKQEEVTFSVNGGGKRQIIDGIKEYDPDGKENNKENNKGLDHSYSKVTTPGYAHSYLLTSILSDDYIDSDDILGPSEGDRGTYTKFNYSKLNNHYKYRTPHTREENIASYNAGMLSKDDDNKSSYVYGEKEIWYMHSIETRTHVAQFYLKDRKDGRGAKGENGGLSSVKQKYLDKIVLYSKSDKRNTDPEPIKTVHFEYDYSLCPNVPNNVNEGDGKLTLKKVWYTYGRSEKGVLNPYVFTYADRNFDGQIDDDLNPDYNIRNHDRWGNFKKDITSTSEIGESNAEFPYVLQDEADPAKNAWVYALTSIKTPTGGTIRVYYEADDYAYVQDKRAMRMFRVEGFSDNNTPNSDGVNNILYTGRDGASIQKDYIVVDLAEGYIPSEGADVNKEFRERYLAGIDQMYFNAFVNVLSSEGAFISDDQYEHVPGYAQIDKNASIVIGSVNGDGAYTKAKIKLKKVAIDDLGGKEINPIVKHGWMFTRLRLNKEAYGGTNANDNQLLSTLYALLKTAVSVGELFTNFAEKMLGDGSSDTMDLERSFVRLNEPDKIKIGGGHRVKAIVMSDNWGAMRANSESQDGNDPDEKETAYYGQKYDYRIKENGVEISSGIAAFEPIIGGDENPFRLPITQREKGVWIADKEYYMETPFGESFFPPAVVGYRSVGVIPVKVTAAELLANNFNPNSLQGDGTGYVKHEFYTSYDFPTKTTNTDIETHRHKPNIILQFMKFDSHDVISSSQGYAIELNDMHGKPKSKRVYPDVEVTEENPDGAAPISEVEYRYKVNDLGDLVNEVTTVNQDLSVSNERIGVDVDLVQDQRYSESETVGGGLDVNVKVVIYGIFPVVTVIPFPDVNLDYTRFRSIVNTKVINKSGVLDNTLVRDNGSTIVKKNLAWDAKTAEVVLTQTENEFHDPIYEFNYPGHWVYQRAGLSTYNEGFKFDGSVSPSDPIFVDGDEVYVEDSLGYYHVNLTDSGKVFIDKGGQFCTLPSGKKGKIIRSGGRNNYMLPIGSVRTLKNPIQGEEIVFDEIVNSNVSEYKDEWDQVCRCEYRYGWNDGYYRDIIYKGGSVIDAGEFQITLPDPNPFIIGKKGVLKPYRSWAYLTNRVQSNINNNVNIRKDGIYESYTPFWVTPPEEDPGEFPIPPELNPCTGEEVAKDYLIPDPQIEENNTQWQYAQQIKKYNATGLSLEEKDPLDRYTMAQYGYGRNLQVAISNNSQYQESAFDGFEDYDFEECEDDHLSWREVDDIQVQITNAEAHTGRKSLKVPKNGTIEAVKSGTDCWPLPPPPPLPNPKEPDVVLY